MIFTLIKPRISPLLSEKIRLAAAADVNWEIDTLLPLEIDCKTTSGELRLNVAGITALVALLEQGIDKLSSENGGSVLLDYDDCLRIEFPPADQALEIAIARSDLIIGILPLDRDTLSNELKILRNDARSLVDQLGIEL